MKASFGISLRYQVESYSACLGELKAIYPQHWQEIALNKDQIELDPDYELYAKLDELGAVHLVTARDGRFLVGYHISFIRPHLHYRRSLTAFTDIFYLLPEYRRGLNGYNLLKFFVDSVREIGVERIYMMTKLAIDLTPILDRLGFSEIEHLHTLTFPKGA